jgi:hypothetical protein
MTPLPVILVAEHRAQTPAQAAKALAREARLCRGKLTLTGEGVGVVRVGQTVEAVRRACHIARPKLKKGEAPPPETLIEFMIGGAPVQIETTHGRVWRVIVSGGSLRTADKLGVGDSLAALLASSPARASEAEGVVYAATAAHCGMSFALSYEPTRGEDRDSWTAEGLARLPLDTTISRILMTGCNSR